MCCLTNCGVCRAFTSIIPEMTKPCYIFPRLFFCLRKMCVCVWTNLSSSSGLPNFIDLHKEEIDCDSPSSIQNQQHTFPFSFPSILCVVVLEERENLVLLVCIFFSIIFFFFILTTTEMLCELWVDVFVPWGWRAEVKKSGWEKCMKIVWNPLSQWGRTSIKLYK